MTDTLTKLFEENLNDLYNAETQFLEAMPKLYVAAKSPQLKVAIEAQTRQTAVHIERLTKVAERIGVRPTGKTSKAAEGLTEEVEDLGRIPPGAVRDIAIIHCAQKKEHYEICCYGTILEWAKQLDLSLILPLLEHALADDKATDSALSSLARDSVNTLAPLRGGSSVPSTRQLVDFTTSAEK